MKFHTDMHGHQRMNPTQFNMARMNCDNIGDPLDVLSSAIIWSTFLFLQKM